MPLFLKSLSMTVPGLATGNLPSQSPQKYAIDKILV
jgi:hypothetical protein